MNIETAREDCRDSKRYILRQQEENTGDNKGGIQRQHERNTKTARDEYRDNKR